MGHRDTGTQGHGAEGTWGDPAVAPNGAIDRDPAPQPALGEEAPGRHLLVVQQLLLQRHLQHCRTQGNPCPQALPPAGSLHPGCPHILPPMGTPNLGCPHAPPPVLTSCQPPGLSPPAQVTGQGTAVQEGVTTPPGRCHPLSPLVTRRPHWQRRRPVPAAAPCCWVTPPLPRCGNVFGAGDTGTQGDMGTGQSDTTGTHGDGGHNLWDTWAMPHVVGTSVTPRGHMGVHGDMWVTP